MGYSGKEPLLGEKKPNGFCRGRLPQLLTLVVIFAAVYVCFWSYNTRISNIDLEDQVKFYKGIVRNMTDRLTRITDRCNRDIRLINQSADNLKQCCSSRNEQERLALECNSKLAEGAAKCKEQLSQQSEHLKKIEQESNAKLQTCLKKSNSNDLQGHSKDGQGVRGQNLIGENTSKLPNIPPVEGRGLDGGIRGKDIGWGRTSNVQKGQSLNNKDQKVPNNTLHFITPKKDNVLQMAAGKAENVTGAIKTTTFMPIKDAVGLAIKTLTSNQLKEANSEKGVSKLPDGKKNDKGIAPLGDLDGYDDDYNNKVDIAKKGKSTDKIQGLKTLSPKGAVPNEVGKGKKDQLPGYLDKDSEYEYDN